MYSILEETPGQLVFGRDIAFNEKLEAKWQAIHASKAKQAVNSNIIENSKRRKFQ